MATGKINTPRVSVINNDVSSDDNVRFSMQSDGRFQIMFGIGSTRRLVEFSENGQIQERKSTDGGATWTTLWTKS